jgi:hypothetical protein
MTAPKASTPTETRERLEQQADAVRERLISGIDELTDRSQRVEALVETVVDAAKRHKKPLIVAGVGITVLSLVAIFKHRATVKRRERRRTLGYLAMQLLGVSPPPPKEPGFMRKSIGTVGTMVASLAVKELQQRVLAGVGALAQQDDSESGPPKRA